MLALKATYDNGTVKWQDPPKVGGRHKLIILFEDIDTQPDHSYPIDDDQHNSTGNWSQFKDLIGCVAEKTNGSVEHDTYLTNAMKP